MNWHVENMLKLVSTGAQDFALDTVFIIVAALVVAAILNCFGAGVIQAFMVLVGSLVVSGAAFFLLAVALAKITEV